MNKKPRQVPNTSNGKNADDNSAEFTDILENPVDLQGDEFIKDYDAFEKLLKPLKDKIISIEKCPPDDTCHIARRMVSLYRLRINYFSKRGNPISVHKTIANYQKWKKDIIKAGRLGNHFDIFNVSEEDIEQLRKVLKEITTPIETTKPALVAVQQAKEVDSVGVLEAEIAKPIAAVAFRNKLFATMKKWIGAAFKRRLPHTASSYFRPGYLYQGIGADLEPDPVKAFFGHFVGVKYQHKGIIKDGGEWDKNK